MKTTVVGLAFTLVASMAFASKNPEADSKEESDNLAFCSMIAGEAKYAALYKLSGKSQDETLALYNNTTKAYPLQAAIVERAYAHTVNNVHTFSIFIFEDCATQLAKIPPDRISVIKDCYLDRLIADYALHMKKNPHLKQSNDEVTDTPDKDRINRILNFVNNDSDKADIKGLIWSQCVSTLPAR